jgi:hypothetical protein
MSGTSQEYSNSPYAKPSSPIAFRPHAAAATNRSGQILGYSKDGYPIRAAADADAVGGNVGVLGGYHFRSKDITGSIACGGSDVIFVAVGLALGWLIVDKFASYIRNKRL